MVGPTRCSARPFRGRPSRALLPLIVLASVVLALWAVPALAGQASAGELLFYPCSSCHPVTVDGNGQPDSALPIEFSGHEIVLEGHDALGEGSAACLACHDDPAKDPGMLKLADGSLIEIDGDVSQVCFQCHSDKYNEWMAGSHGPLRSACTDSGCHDPHTPGYIFAEGLLPFVGSGFQFKVLSVREPFKPLAPPAPEPPYDTPTWFTVLAILALAVAARQTVMLVRGRQQR